ncbi:ABC transporter permease [Lactococcus raffinolactis]|uniref:ABC transporter permease n=1 Tax=Pseudolactococcus raffinolactis TaxID=1366 RepID=UPI000BB467E7|nr:ABC transporter permease [Lactococcus raffinolactis]ATC61460.1 LPS ABC transporter [Lactococcus raffinolactis]
MSSKNWILLKELVKTDFKLRYQGSLMGHLWSILKPLMLFAVMYTVFIYFLRFGGDVPHFAVALLLGMVLWTFFTETTGMGLTSIVGRGDLLRKLSFPSQIIVVSVSINALINLVINLGIVLILGFINGVEISIYAFPLIPLLLIELYALALGISFILSTLFVRFRDIGPIWEVFLQAGMYMTPIIYPISFVAGAHPLIAKVMMLSPLAQIIQDARYLLTSSETATTWQMISNKGIAIIPYLIPFIVLLIGFSIFNKSAKKFAEIL